MHFFQFLGAITLTFMGLQAQSQESTKQVPIVDPVLSMPAWTISIPSSWTLSGTMLPNSSCNGATSPTFHAHSADGKIGMYLLPRIDWAWGANVHSGSDCLPLSNPVDAKAFLTNFLETRGLKAAGEEPVPELAGMRRNNDAMNRQMQGMRRGTVDEARLTVNYSVAGNPVQESITAIVQCFDARIAGIGQQSGCSAFVTRCYAPKDKFEAMRPAFKAVNETLNQAWMDRWTQAMRNQNIALTAGQTETMLQQGRVAQRARANQQKSFMEAFNHQADARNGAFAAQQQNKQVQSDNFVDYVLDCSRLYGSNVRVSVGANCPNRQTY